MSIQKVLSQTALLILLTSCTPTGSGPTQDAAPLDTPPMDATVSAQSATTPVVPQKTADPEPPAAEHLQLLKLTLTTEVKNKEPVDNLNAAPAGQRIYAHLAVRNRTGRTRQVELQFQVNGQTRTRLVLDVEESWQWRTWGYNTIRDSDTGDFTVIVQQDDGLELMRKQVPIQKKTNK